MSEHPAQNGTADRGEDPDDGGPYGVYGEGRPRRIVGDSDDPPRRRPRVRPAPSSDSGPGGA